MAFPKVSSTWTQRRSFAACALASALAACTGQPGDGSGDMATDGALSPSPVTIEFRPVVGTRPFACGQRYDGVGLGAASTIEAADFRLYVHDFRLIDAAGGEVPVALEADQRWQHQGVALLDFEDKSGACTGTSAMNGQVRGAAPGEKKEWRGIRFKLGIPFALNHGDAATAPSPLNLTSMFWSWQGGYKFARIEGQNGSGLGFIVHLGSTGCMKDGSGTVVSCQAPNRAEIALDGFRPDSQAVAVDLAALLSGTDLGKEVECMSGPGVADCPPLFERLGLPYGGAPVALQRLFRVE